MREIIYFTLFLFLYSNIVYTQSNDYKIYDSIIQSSENIIVKQNRVEHLLKNLEKQNSRSIYEIYYNYSKWSYSILKDTDKAILYSEKLINNIEHIKELGLLRKKSLFNLGFFYRKKEYPNFTKSLDYYTKLIQISGPNEVRIGKTYKEMADIYADLGDFQTAIENYTNAERIFKTDGNDRLLLRTYINISHTFVSLNDTIYVESFFDILEKIEKLKKNISISLNYQIILQLNTAVIHGITERHERAIPFYLKGIELMKNSKDYTHAFNLYNGIGVIFKRLKNNERANYYFNKSKRYIDDNRLSRSIYYVNNADLYLSNKNYTTALHYYKKAIQNLIVQSKKDSAFRIKELVLSPFKKDVIDYLYQHGNALISYYLEKPQRKVLLEAEQSFAFADQILDLLFLESNEELSKLYWRKRAVDLYDKAIYVCYQLGLIDKAFYYMEKSKGLLLIQNKSSYHAKKMAQVPDSIIDLESMNLHSLKKIERSLLNPQLSTIQLDSLKNHLFILKKGFRRFKDSIELTYPLYARIKNNLQIKSITTVQKSLKENEIVIEYNLGQSVGFVILIEKNNKQLFKIEEVEKLKILLKKYRSIITKPFSKKKDIIYLESISNQIVKIIFPFLDSQKNMANKTLIIVADSDLLTLPFEALKLIQEIPLESVYLIQICNMYYKLSMSSHMSEKKSQPFNNNIVGFLPITFSNNYVESLPLGTKELVEILPFTTHTYTHKEASKECFLDSYNKNNIIHLSTHGGIDNNRPWLALNDQKIWLDELYGYNKKEMIVLSACKTAVGKHHSGEGLFSITRGFLNTGTKSVISTMWDVNEKSSLEIITNFYKHLSKNMSKSEALREAKLSYLSNYKNTSQASPFYWSPIILTGGNDSLLFPKSVDTNWPILFLCFGSVFFLIIIYFTFKQKSISS